MSISLWIAFGFVAFLVLFLVATYFVQDKSTHGQYKTLRFLTALCAGFAGGFLTGDAIFSMQQQWSSGGKIAISGTAGCALFFAVWFTYGAVTGGGTPPPPPPNRVRLAFPGGLTFEQAIASVAEAANANFVMGEFSTEQRSEILPEFQVDAPSWIGAFSQVGLQTKSKALCKVTNTEGVFHINP